MADFVDLHMHTTASDGILAPEDLVAATVSRGLTVIAVTDHDTLASVQPAIEAAAHTPMLVLAGVEVSGLYDGHSIHLLGYGIDAASAVFAARLRGIALGREERAHMIVEMLAAMGAPIQWETVVALGQGTIARPHIARALVQEGHARDVTDAFARFLGEGCPAYLPSGRLSAEEAIGLIRDAGGQAALAHPMLLPNTMPLESVLDTLCAAGLTGLEVYHTEHTASATAQLLQIAAERSLWWSGGSDFHGPTKPQASLGGVQVPVEVLEQGPFPAALAAARARRVHAMSS